MIKYSLLATVTAVISTLISIFVFKSFGTSSTIACACITAVLISYIWGKSQKRLPKPGEKTAFLIFYWLMMLIIFLVPTAVLPHTASGLGTMFVLASAYPIFMSIFFKEKFLIKYVEESAQTPLN